MAKPVVVTEMQLWMLESGLRDPDVAERLTVQMGKSISARQVFRWRKGLSYPRPGHVKALEKLSNGRVNANTFADAATKTPGEPLPDG